MAGARATASVSVTIGVALATCVVAGAILVGPTLVDCSNGLAACLRHRIDPNGLLGAPRNEAPPAQSVGDTLHRGGWIEANATEYDVRLPARATLDGASGSGILRATGSASAVPDIAHAALAPPMGRIDAGGTVGGARRADGATALAALSAPTGGTLVVSGSAPMSAVSAHMTIAGGPELFAAIGQARATAGALEAAAVLTAKAGVDPVPTGELTAAGAGRAAVSQSASGRATYVVAAMASGTSISAPASTSTPRLDVPAQRAPTLRPEPPRRVWRADPRYPSIVLLPPPAKGRNSSFTTLKLR